MTHMELCRQMLAAIREVGERNGLHVEQSGDAVNQLVSATARAALAITQAADPNAKSVSAFKAQDGSIGVAVRSGGEFLDVVCE